MSAVSIHKKKRVLGMMQVFATVIIIIVSCIPTSAKRPLTQDANATLPPKPKPAMNQNSNQTSASTSKRTKRRRHLGAAAVAPQRRRPSRLLKN